MTSASAAPADNGGPPVMVVIPDDASGANATPPPTTAAAPRPVEPTPVEPVVPAAPVPAGVPTAAGAVVVHDGDNLWTLAATALERSWGRPPRPAEVVPYWRSIIDRNVSAFVRGGDPDLIYAGQVIDLPPPPPAPP
jgi:nucleoid-associated protein YgaU